MIHNLVMFIEYYLSLFVNTGPENPQREVAIHLHKSYSAWTERNKLSLPVKQNVWQLVHRLSTHQKLTVPILSKLANNSLRVMINSSAVHLDESSVNPTISANKMLQIMKD